MAKKSTRAERSEGRRAAHAAAADVYAALAEGSARSRLMSRVEGFRAVPTGFCSFNRASTVGGAPLGCVWLVHGPTHGGKTTFVVELMCSVQRLGGVVEFIDAEQAADTKRWLGSLGVDLEKAIYFGRVRPDEELERLTFEAVRTEVRRLRKKFRDMRVSGAIPWGTPMLIVVDSLSKLVPEAYLRRVGGEENGRAGVGRDQANLNAEWMLELGADVGSDDVIVALVAHEYEVADSTKGWAGYKVRGGNAVLHESMMSLRVVFAGQVFDHSADDAKPVGKRHRVEIEKNKVGPGFRRAVFYTATGDGLVPLGFDRAREVVHEALERKLIEGPDPKLRGFSLTLGTRLQWRRRKFSLKQAIQDAGFVDELAAELDGKKGLDEVPPPGAILAPGDAEDQP